MYCADCEQLDNYFFDNTTFWLFFPTVESVSKAISFCGQNHYAAKQHESHCISAVVPKMKLQSFLLGLFGEFEPSELANTKITTTTGDQPDISEIGRILPADVLINRFNSTWIVDSIEANNFETHFQPIVTLDSENTPTTYGYEGLFRIKDANGNIVPPAHVFQLAEHSDLLFNLDLVARRSSVGHYAKSKLNGKLFINFNPSSIYDPSYCLRATASAIGALGLSPESVVFELTETQKVSNESVMKGILNFYRNAGFQVALDDIGSGWSGLNMLHKFRPDYVKIDMELIRNLHVDHYKQAIVKHLIEIARDNNIKVIAEGIETQDELCALRQFNPDYYQGYMFSKPKRYDFQCTEGEQQDIDNMLAGIR